MLHGYLEYGTQSNQNTSCIRIFLTLYIFGMLKISISIAEMSSK